MGVVITSSSIIPDNNSNFIITISKEAILMAGKKATMLSPCSAKYLFLICSER
jgi:hypothetical protein